MLECLHEQEGGLGGIINVFFKPREVIEPLITPFHFQNVTTTPLSSGSLESVVCKLLESALLKNNC